MKKTFSTVSIISHVTVEPFVVTTLSPGKNSDVLPFFSVSRSFPDKIVCNSSPFSTHVKIPGVQRHIPERCLLVAVPVSKRMDAIGLPFSTR